MKARSYYSVSGERQIRDETGKVLAVAKKSVRFESIALSDAEHFAGGVYRSEGIICEIHEVQRT